MSYLSLSKSNSGLSFLSLQIKMENVLIIGGKKANTRGDVVVEPGKEEKKGNSSKILSPASQLFSCSQPFPSYSTHKKPPNPSMFAYTEIKCKISER